MFSFILLVIAPASLVIGFIYKLPLVCAIGVLLIIVNCLISYSAAKKNAKTWWGEIYAYLKFWQSVFFQAIFGGLTYGFFHIFR